eukprot:1446513-Amphidinium_carterae.1
MFRGEASTDLSMACPDLSSRGAYAAYRSRRWRASVQNTCHIYGTRRPNRHEKNLCYAMVWTMSV